MMRGKPHAILKSFFSTHHTNGVFHKPVDAGYFTGNSSYYSYLTQINNLIKKYNLNFNDKVSHSSKWLNKHAMMNDLSLRLTDESYSDFVNRLNLLYLIDGLYLILTLEPEVREVLQQFVPVGKSHNRIVPELQLLDEYSRSYSVASRKTCNAQVWMLPGNGQVFVNGISFARYFPQLACRERVIKPFELTDKLGEMNVWAVVSGSGLKSQADAIAVAISRGLVIHDAVCDEILRSGNQFH